MSGDWMDGLNNEERERWDEFVAHFRRDALGKIAGSSAFLAIAPGDQLDVKFCTELGAAIMLDKPVIVVAFPGRDVPPMLGRIAFRVVQADLDTEDGAAEIAEALRDLQNPTG